MIIRTLAKQLIKDTMVKIEIVNVINDTIYYTYILDSNISSISVFDNTLKILIHGVELTTFTLERDYEVFVESKSYSYLRRHIPENYKIKVSKLKPADCLTEESQKLLDGENYYLSIVYISSVSER